MTDRRRHGFRTPTTATSTAPDPIASTDTAPDPIASTDTAPDPIAVADSALRIRSFLPADRVTPAVTTNDRWLQLLAEMETIAAEYEEDGWETLSIAAGDAAAVGPENGHVDGHGYVYVVPGDDAAAFEELFVPAGFPRTEVYRATTATHLFLATAFLDPSSETAIVLAGVLDRDGLADCERAARETGVMYSHLRKVDGTHLGSFEHDEPTLFFPD